MAHGYHMPPSIAIPQNPNTQKTKQTQKKLQKINKQTKQQQQQQKMQYTIFSPLVLIYWNYFRRETKSIYYTDTKNSNI